MAKKPVTLEGIRRLVLQVAALVAVSLIAIVTFFVLDDRADEQQRIERVEAVCDAVRDGFHEQALLFGEFADRGPNDPELIEYDRRLQERLESCESAK